jgi:hypothetical protein
VVLTAETEGSKTTSIKARFGGMPEGATLAVAGASDKVSVSGNMVTVKNPGLGKVEVPMVITTAEGAVTEFVLVADFGHAIRYALRGWYVQDGKNIDIKSGDSTVYFLIDTRDVDGGYIEVTESSRNFLGKYEVPDANAGAIRIHNPVYDMPGDMIGYVKINLLNVNNEIVDTYMVNVRFGTWVHEGEDATGNKIEKWTFEDYTPVHSVLRATYEVSEDQSTIEITAEEGVQDVYVNFGKYYSEKLTANVNDENIKHTGARSWRIHNTGETVTFEVYFDATAFGGEVVTRTVIVHF